MHTINQTDALLPPATAYRKHRTIAGFLRWALGAASSEAVNNMNVNMKKIHFNLEHSIDIQNANARSLNAFMRTTNNRLAETVKGVSNNSKAISEIQDRLRDIIDLVTNNNTGFNAIYKLAKLTPELIALIRKDIALLKEVQIRVLDFENGIFNLVNGRLSPDLIPVETLLKGIEKIKSIVYENLHGLRVRYEHPLYYYSNSKPVYALQGDQVIVNIEIPLAPDKDIFKLYKVHHVGSPITFANTSDFHVSVISNLPAAIAVSEDNAKWMELSADDIDSCIGRDILTCPGAIAYRVLAPNTCASAIWLKNNQQVEKYCNFIYQNKPFKSDIIFKIDNSKYAMFSPDRKANIACPGQPQKVVILNGLTVLQLGCGCSISTTKLILPPQVSACSKNDRVTKVEYPINAALLSDLADAGEIPDSLIKEGMSLEPWAIAYKPPKYRAADTALLARQQVSVDEIQNSLRENRLIRLPDFDINSKTSEFSLLTTIPSLIVIGIVVAIMACVFYKLRYMGAVLAALSGPTATNAYTFVDPTPCPIIDRCATVEDMWMTSSVALVNLIVLVILATIAIFMYIFGKKSFGTKTQVMLQVNIGQYLETLFVTKLPFQTSKVARSNAEIIGTMSVRKTMFKQVAVITWVSNLIIDNCLDGNNNIAFKLPSIIPVNRKLATAIYNSSPGSVMVRLLVSDGIIATMVPIYRRDDPNLGWVPMVPPKGPIQV